MENSKTLFENLKWLSGKEAAEYLRTTTGNIRVLVYRGIIKPRKIGRRSLFKKDELDALLESSIKMRSLR